MKVILPERRVCKIDQEDLACGQYFKIGGLDAQMFLRTSIRHNCKGWAVCVESNSLGWSVGGIAGDGDFAGQVTPVDPVTHEPEYSSCGVEKTFGELNLGDVWSDIGGGEFRIRSESGCFNLLDNHFHTDEACYSYSAKQSISRRSSLAPQAALNVIQNRLAYYAQSCPLDSRSR